MRNTPHATGELRQNLDLQISRLPQAREIEPEDRNRWVEAALDLTEGDARMASYLVHRRSGFFPADTAALLAEQSGKPLGRSAHDVVTEKLFRTLPQATSIDAVRTLRAEDVMRDLFLAKVEGLTRNVEAIDDVSTFCHPDHPWMMDSPQDILTLGGHVVLADYRAPDGDLAKEYREKGLPPEFQARMMQRMVLSFAAGYPPARSMVVVFDHSRWDIDIHGVDFDRSMARELVACGDRFWNDFVLKGCVPPPPTTEIVDPSKLPPSVFTLMGDIAKLKVVEDAVSSSLSEKTDALKAELKDAGNLGKATVVSLDGVLNVSAKPELDIAGMQDRLSALRGVKAVDECHGEAAADLSTGYQILEQMVAVAKQVKDGKFTAKAFVDKVAGIGLPKLPAPIDPEKLSTALVALGETPSRFTTEKYRIGLSRKETGPSAELLSAMKDEAALAVNKAMSQLGQNPQVPPPPAEAPESSPKRLQKRG